MPACPPLEMCHIIVVILYHVKVSVPATALSKSTQCRLDHTASRIIQLENNVNELSNGPANLCQGDIQIDFREAQYKKTFWKVLFLITTCEGQFFVISYC